MQSPSDVHCRDVFNEKPTLEEVGAAAIEGGGADADTEALPRGAIIHTSKGDITLKMFPDECPKTVENFATHARNGYYDGAGALTPAVMPMERIVWLKISRVMGSWKQSLRWHAWGQASSSTASSRASCCRRAIRWVRPLIARHATPSVFLTVLGVAGVYCK